jgi:hypothetical protein
MLGLMALVAACGTESMAAPGQPVAARQDGGESGDRHEAGKVLTATLHGVPRPFTGAANAVRGVAGAGLPWVVAQGRATLRADGTLEAEVEGLVFDPTDAAVIARGTGGTNPLPQAMAIVSCLTVQDGAAATVNVSSAPVPFTTGAATAGGGNATIEERLTLPSPCLAPVVFVSATNGTWLAVAGF